MVENAEWDFGLSLRVGGVLMGTSRYIACSGLGNVD